MSVKFNSQDIQYSIDKCRECIVGLEGILEQLEDCHFLPDRQYADRYAERRDAIKEKIQTLMDDIEDTQKKVEEIKEDFEIAEQKNKNVAQSIEKPTAVIPRGGSTRGNSVNVVTPSADTSKQIDSTGTQTDTPTNVGELKQDSVQLENDTGIESDTPADVEINDGEQNVELEEKVPDTQVEAVIALIYGQDTTIPDDTKERIVEAIADINKTEILDGLDEDIANQIRSEITKDYLDGKLELEGIEAEDLQEYINSQPSIKIQFEINEALASFDSLIESGVLTKDQIKAVIEENIEIHDEQEFEKLYIENIGTEAEATNIESFYDPETQKIHIRNTVESEVITVSIVTVLNDILFYNEETGEVSYNNVNGLNQDINVNIGDGQTNSTSTEVENIDSGVTIETPEDGKDAAGTITQTGNISESDTTINMPNQPEGQTDKK